MVNLVKNMNSGYVNKIYALLAFILGIGCSLPVQAAVREYWIAAEKTSWNYAPSGRNLIEPDDGLGEWGQTLTYTKYRYIGYSDGSYATPLPQPASMGILGPQLRAVVGDILKVHFLNKTDRPLSMHPHGVLYNKDNEGADGGAGSRVAPGARYTYT